MDDDQHSFCNSQSADRDPDPKDRSKERQREEITSFGGISMVVRRDIGVVVGVVVVWIKMHLGAAKEGDASPILSKDLCVPHLGRTARVDLMALAAHDALRGGAEKVCLELHRAKVVAVVGERDKGAVATRRVGQGDDAPAVEEAIGSEVLLGLQAHRGDAAAGLEGLDRDVEMF